MGLAGVDFIKIDVEGFELFVLQGAQRILRIHEPAVLCEVTDVSRERYGSSAHDVFDLLYDIGYHSYVWQNRNFVPRSAQLSGLNNYFFLHRSRPYSVEDLGAPGPSAGSRF